MLNLNTVKYAVRLPTALVAAKHSCEPCHTVLVSLTLDNIIEVIAFVHNRTLTLAVLHMSINLTVVVLFAINAWLRYSAGDAGTGSSTPVWLSLLAIGLLLISGWLGGKMVYESAVAVDTESL